MVGAKLVGFVVATALPFWQVLNVFCAVGVWRRRRMPFITRGDRKKRAKELEIARLEKIGALQKELDDRDKEKHQTLKKLALL